MAFFRRVCAYCLFLAVLMYATPFQQFFKIPAMLDHYAEHKARKPGLSLLDFLFMHYIGDDGVADDESKDMSLPFKKSTNGGSSLHDASGPQVAAFFPKPLQRPTGITYCPFRTQVLPDAYKGELLRPPQA
jgi:hypothetical protein